MRAGTPCSPLGARRAVFLASPTTENSYSVADRAYHREGIKMKSGIRNIARGASVVAVLTMLTACSTGAYLYVTAGSGIVGYGIDGTTGMLTPLPGFPVVTGTDAYSVALDPTNQFLYGAND